MRQKTTSFSLTNDNNTMKKIIELDSDQANYEKNIEFLDKLDDIIEKNALSEVEKKKIKNSVCTSIVPKEN